MSENTNDLNPDLARLADALGALAPASTTINRDRLLFEAGRAAAHRNRRIWLVATLGIVGAATVFAAMTFTRSPARLVVVERERIVEKLVIAAPSASDAPEHYESPERSEQTASSNLNLSPEMVRMFQIRQDVARWGPDILPTSMPTEESQSAPLDKHDLDRWLGVPPGTLTAPIQRSPRRFPGFLGDL